MLKISCLECKKIHDFWNRKNEFFVFFYYKNNNNKLKISNLKLITKYFYLYFIVIKSIAYNIIYICVFYINYKSIYPIGIFILTNLL